MRKFYKLIFPLALILQFEAKAQPFGYYLTYDGSDDYATLPSGIVSSIGGSFTIEAWVYWTGNNNFFPRIIDFGTDQNNWVALTSANPNSAPNGPVFGINVAGNLQIVSATTALPINQWVHIAVTLDNTTSTTNLFINGQLNATGSITHRLSSLGNTPNNWLGRSEYAVPLGPDAYYQGSIDELRISNSIRYSSNFTPPAAQFVTDANTVALYHFNEGTGQTTADASANNGAGFRGSNSSIETTDPTWQTNSILPVRLIDFSASLNLPRNNVALKWAAYQDDPVNVKIEKSADGKLFSQVGELSGSASINIQNFEFTDQTPAKGRNYYRLKFTELTGNIMYSRVIPVNNNNDNRVDIYPNPLKNQTIRFELPAIYSGPLTISISNALGSVIFSQSSNVTNQREFIINQTKDLNRGTYILKITTNNFKKTGLFLVE